MIQKKNHQKRQTFSSDFFNDLCINGNDGLIIIFFITTGLMSAGLSNIDIATIGMIAGILVVLVMTISAHLARRAEKKHFLSLDNQAILDAEDQQEKELLENLGIGKHIQSLAQEEIEKDRVLWRNLMAKLEEEKNVNKDVPALKRTLITGASFFIGCIIPVIPYILETDPKIALKYSGIFSLVTIFILGYFKSAALETPKITGAFASLFIGVFAGTGGYFIAKLFVQIIN